MVLIIRVRQNLRVALGIAPWGVGIAGTVVPIFPGVPVILEGVALMHADHPRVTKAKAKSNQAFLDRGINRARDQRGCSTPFGIPRNFVPAASCGEY